MKVRASAGNIRRIIFASFVALVMSLTVDGAPINGAQQQSTARPLRVALVGFADSSQKVDWRSRGAFATLLVGALKSGVTSDARVTLVDDSLTNAALAGVGYGGSLNLSLAEARNIGAAVGCDFFILGKADSFTRSERAGEAHEESFAGVLIGDGRTGRLAHFDFIVKKALRRETSQTEVARELETRAAEYVRKMFEFRAAREAAAPVGEAAEELPDADSAPAAGFTPPEFSSRTKPAFTEAADRADVNATVEARVVFRATGEIGEIEITRWAGFGLEESSIDAIRQLKFKPATRGGKPLSVRALVQYNFRRLDR